MDTNLIFSLFVLIIFALISIEWDEAFILFILGLLSVGIAINLETAFSIDNTTYQGFGELIQLSYAFVGIFAIVKTFSDSLLSRMRGRKHDN